MNVWPPFLGAGIHIRSISADWSEAAVELRARLLNRNYVWDHPSNIEFISPGRGTVIAMFRLPQDMVAGLPAVNRHSRRALLSTFAAQRGETTWNSQN
jgi:hypothetical protein